MGRTRAKRRFDKADEGDEKLASKRPKRTVEKEKEDDEHNNCENNARSEKESCRVLNQEVERQIAATRSIRDVGIEQMLTALRLLRSNFDKEQLQTPVLQFFRENYPNLSLLKNDEDGQIEVKWNDKDGQLFMNQTDGADIHASLFHRMSIGYSNYSSRPSFGGFDISESVRRSILGTDNLRFRDVGASGGQMHEMHDAFKTPGGNSERLSIGMTPKTRRLPKPGEILLSVHGSPLGVFNEDDKIMGPITEEDG